MYGVERMKIALLFLFVAIVLLILGLLFEKAKISVIIGVVGIIASVVLYLNPYSPPAKEQSAGDSASYMVPDESTPIGDYSSNDNAGNSNNYPASGRNMKTEYGKALNDGVDYTLSEKISIIVNSYYDRKDANGNYKEGYDSHMDKSNVTGYILSLYYADDYLYFAEVRDADKTTLVKLYYWNGELVACNDLRGNDSGLHRQGSDVFERVSNEFSEVYSVGKR